MNLPAKTLTKLIELYDKVQELNERLSEIHQKKRLARDKESIIMVDIELCDTMQASLRADTDYQRAVVEAANLQ